MGIFGAAHGWGAKRSASLISVTHILPLMLTLFRMGIFRATHGWGQKGPPPYYLSHISYNDETFHSYTLPKEDLKNL